MSDKKSSSDTHLNNLEERLSALERAVQLRDEHREGKHGEAAVDGCPHCPREMTAALGLVPQKARSTRPFW